MALYRFTTEFETEEEDGHRDPWSAVDDLREQLEGTNFQLVRCNEGYYLAWEGDDE